MAGSNRRKEPRGDRGYDRRRSVRLGDDIPVKTTTADGFLELSCAMDVSESGIFVEYVLPYPEGTELRVEFQLADIGRIGALAVVVSARNFLPSDVSDRIGNGLRFIEIGEIEQHRIRRFLERALND